jgi:hypothetical protein
VLLIVVVSRVDISNGMNEAQDEPLGSPVDHNIHGHIVLVQGDLVYIREGCGSAAEAQFPTDARKA